jgi:choline kinase
MKAIVLAAGRGSRMKTLTEDRPKCFVKIRGRTLLERQLAALHGAGITEVGVVRGYRGDAFDGLGLSLFDNEHWQGTNMVSSLRCADQWLGQFDCIVSYSDIFYGVDTVKRLASSTAPLAIAFDPQWRWLWSRRFADPLTDAETLGLDGAGRIVDIGHRPKSYEEIGGQYMGLLRFTPTAWRQVADYLDGLAPALVRKLDMTSLLSRLIAIGVTVAGVPIAEAWGEVDSESDLTLYETLAEREPKLQKVLI